jgi:hypothetical protein
VEKHNIQLANFDLASLRVIWFRWGRSVVSDAHERIARCGLGIVPVSSETGDKFENAIGRDDKLTSLNSPASLVRFNQVARRIVNANHSLI